MKQKVPEDRPWFKVWPEGVPRSLDYPEIPLFEFLSNARANYPDRTAFTSSGKSVTYEQVDEATNKVAAYLAGQGMKEGDSGVLFLSNSVDFVIGYYGILKAGGIVSPANPLYTDEELAHQVNDCNAFVIITNEEFRATAARIKEMTNLKVLITAESGSESSDGAISLDEVLSTSLPDVPSITVNPEEDIAAIEYTGGTTGLPKGAMLTHYNLVANAIQNATWLGWSSEEVIMGVLPFYHSWGACTCVNSPIYSGAHVITLSRFDAHDLLGAIQNSKATVLYGVASMFTMLVSSPALNQYDLSSLKYVKAGAMLIPPEIKEKWERITGVKMLTGYGLSEASPETHDSPPARVKPGTIGIPIMDTDARIMDEETGKTEMPPGEVGELIIKGSQVMKGYRGSPEETEETLRQGWLHTGDLATMDTEGYFEIVDRKKEIIKYKGYTIAPGELESVLYEHPDIQECAVVGKPDQLAGEVPKAYVVLKTGHTSSQDDILDSCKGKLVSYKRIRLVEFIDEIPKTEVGKVLRRVLKKRELSE